MAIGTRWKGGRGCYRLSARVTRSLDKSSGSLTKAAHFCGGEMYVVPTPRYFNELFALRLYCCFKLHAVILYCHLTECGDE